MAMVVRLSVATGPHQGEKYCFRGPTRCTIGRAPDCFVQLSGTEKDCHISRHHCLLDLDPPAVTVQDLGSQNGTFLGGKRIHRLESAFDEGDPWKDEIHHAGEMLTIGGTTLLVEVVDCPPRQAAADCTLVAWQKGEIAKKACPVPCA